jgi:nucleoside phosphorylase
MPRYSRIGVAGDPNLYAIGEFADPDENLAPRGVLVCQSGMGNSNAATTAADALRSFPNIEHIIMCGIAGGCPNAPDEHVRLGDIVFSNDAGIIEYDFVKETEKGSTVRSSPQKPSSRMLSVVGSLQADEILGRRPWEAGSMQSSPHRKSLLALTTLPIFFTMRTETKSIIRTGRNGRAAPRL